MTERLVLPAPARVKRPRQTRAEAAEVYDYVTARDLAAAPDRHGCRALDIDSAAGECSGPIQRHHAGIKTGTKRVTSPTRVACLCDGHHDRWAPTHNRAILDWLLING